MWNTSSKACERPVSPPDRGFAVGGGTTGGLWPQIVSDVTGMTQQITEQSVGACYGDAMFAGRQHRPGR